MRKQIALFLLLFLFIAACGRRDEEAEELPTPAPTAAVPTPANTPTPRPSTGGETAVQPAVDPDQIDWPPQVVDSSPLPGEEVTLDGAITVRFDQPMNKASVESAFNVQAVDGRGEVQGRFEWPRDDTVIFTPSQLQRRQSYTVRIAGTAAGINGLPMQIPVELQLQTAGYLAVSQVIPDAGTQEVNTDSAITVLFNRPVVPLVTSGQQADLPQPLTIDPPVEGSGEWVSTSIYRFVPDAPLAGDTRYQITLDEELTDVTGAVQERPFTWRFTTMRPDVVSIQPENNAENVPLTRPITVTFNMPMDRSSTEAAVSLSGGDANVAYEWSDDDRVLVLAPQQPLALETEYRLTVGASATSAGGGSTMAGETAVSFQTVRAPAVIDTSPRAGATADRWQRGFTVRFASPMDPETLIDKVRISPEPSGSVRYFYNDFSFELNVDFNLELNSTYNVTVPLNAADPYGNTLGEAYTFRFNTPGRAPLASFNLPGSVAQLSTAFETQVQIINVNVSEINVSLTDVGLPINLLTRPFDVRDYHPAAEPLRTWQFQPTTARDEVTVQAVSLADGGALPTGVYLLSLNSPETGEDVRYWQNQRTLLVVADTNIVLKQQYGAAHVWVTELQSGQPAAGRNLVLYNEQGVEAGTAVSDSNGFASFEYQPAQNYLENITVVSNRPGDSGFGIASSGWNNFVQPWQFGIPTAGPETDTFAYIYTDRPIYRPGDTVYYKGIVRDANYGRYALPEPQNLDLRLYFVSFFGESGLDETLTVQVGPDGSFSGSYELPDDLSLGSYELAFPGLDFETARRFTVAEYRRPEFLVTLTPETPEALRGDTVDVTLAAEYFFGGSAAGLTVQWNVTEEAFRFSQPGPYMAFTDDGGFFYEDPGLFGFGGGFNQIASGQGKTDANGRFTITLPANLLAGVDAGSRRVRIEANVTDISNFPVAARTSVIFHAAELYAGLSAQDNVTRANQETAVDVRTVDWNGDPVPNRSVDVTFYRREWVPTRTIDFGIYRTAWEAVDTEVAAATVTTNGDGQAEASFTPEEGGSYLAVAAVTDRGGRENLSSVLIWVTDDRFVQWQLDPREKRMELVLDQDEYNVGDTARVLVQSPFTETVNAWLTIERGELIEQRVITIEGTSDIVDLNIPPLWAPNVFVTITAIKGVTPDNADNPYADIRLGMAELVVAPDQLALNVELTPQQDAYGPGDTAVYNIRVTDYQGRPVQADLSLALVDLAVLTLKEDNAPPILEAFYSRQPYRGQTGSGLFVSGEGLEPEIPLEGGGLGGGGGDMAAEAALGRAVGDEDDVRRDFPDTAYWEANVSTGADGAATVEIPLPDTLTTWRLSSKAVTAETLVGQGSVDIVSSLPLLLRPVTPRFFTVGDTVRIGAIVNNNTGAAIDATVSLTASGVTPESLPQQELSVPANGQRLVTWEVTALDVTAVDMTFRVEGGGYSDATKPSFGQGPDNVIPVYRYSARDVTATAGVLDEAGRRVEAILLPDGLDLRQGAVQVQLSASLAAALLDALEVTADPPWDNNCAHAIADRLLPNAVTAQAIDTLDLDRPEMVKQLNDLNNTAVARLQNLARADGGWSWCFSEKTDPFLTTYVLYALLHAQQAGVSVSPRVLADAGEYVLDRLEDPADLTEPWEINRQIFMLYVLARLGEDQQALLDAHFEEHRLLMDPWAKALLALTYHETGFSPDLLQTAVADLNDEAIISATGAYWEDGSRDFRNLNSDVRGTAVVLHALTQIEPDNPLLPSVVRWLMSARTVNRWSTVHETAWSIQALAGWMAASGELDADYDYTLNVNLRQQATGSFSQANLADTDVEQIRLAELVPGDVNFVDVQRGAGDGRLYYSLFLDSAIDVTQVNAVSRGVTVQRTYYDAGCDPEAEECDPIEQIEAGQRVRVELSLTVPNDLFYVVVDDPIPAGAEGIDPGLQTSVSDADPTTESVGRDYRYGYWGWWYFNRVEFRDDQVRFLAEFLPAGAYQYTYFLNATIPGEYQVRPAFAYEEFFPEVNGRSDGMIFTITE